MIEGKNPIQNVLNQFHRTDTESIRKLLFRIQKLYSAKSDVQKIFSLIFKIFHDPES